MEVINDTEERYLSYIFLRKSGKQHNKLKLDLQNYFTTGYDRYTKNTQETRILLDKYNNSSVIQYTASEVTAFTQRGGAGNGRIFPNEAHKKVWAH